MPLKKSSITDIAFRLIINDLIQRKQARLPVIAKVLGYKNSTVINKFLKGLRNYPRKKMKDALDTFVNIYNANRIFLETGHGDMYLNTPYISKDDTIKQPGNITTIAISQRITELEEINRKLQERNKQLENTLKAKEEIIKLQRKIIKNTDLSK